MSLITVTTPKHVATGPAVVLEVLYLSESHYIFGRKHSFLTIEIALMPNIDVLQFEFLVHGQIEQDKPVILGNLNSDFSDLKDYSDASPERFVNGVVDLNCTFNNESAETNCAYELKHPDDKIKVVTRDEEIYYCGVAAKISSPEFSCENFDECSFVVVKNKGGRCL